MSADPTGREARRAIDARARFPGDAGVLRPAGSVAARSAAGLRNVGPSPVRLASVFNEAPILAITDDMIGRSLFGNEKEYWNPDLPLPGDPEKLTKSDLDRWSKVIRDAKIQPD